MTAARILVVDDEPGVRYFVTESLSDNDYQVMAVEDGESALDLIASQKFNLVILDLQMGDVGGLDVLAALRQQSPDTVTIVLTAHGSLETAIEALRQGAYDYLLKPCDPDGLRQSVLRGLDKWRLEQQKREGIKLISDISHQLRNPLTTIGLNLELMERDHAVERAHYLDVVKYEALQMKGIVDSVLTLSRLGAENVVATFVPEDINLLVMQVVAAFQAQAEDKCLELVFAPGADLPRVLTRHAYMIQLVTNLVSNALNYTVEGGVFLSTTFDRERIQVCLEIRDTGIGISPEDLPHLFERFYRGRQAIEGYIPGTGLGLAIVKEIVELHKGNIMVESQVGQGTLFRVWLPAIVERTPEKN
ncbi:MAG: response regulator [Anaerolineae bacterium]|nr:response regulator [Anaerolineae bacterium]